LFGIVKRQFNYNFDYKDKVVKTLKKYIKPLKNRILVLENKVKILKEKIDKNEKNIK